MLCHVVNTAVKGLDYISVAGFPASFSGTRVVCGLSTYIDDR